jgi:hypothetical protein
MQVEGAVNRQASKPFDPVPAIRHESRLAASRLPGLAKPTPPSYTRIGIST